MSTRPSTFRLPEQKVIQDDALLAWGLLDALEFGVEFPFCLGVNFGPGLGQILVKLPFRLGVAFGSRIGPGLPSSRQQRPGTRPAISPDALYVFPKPRT